MRHTGHTTVRVNEGVERQYTDMLAFVYFLYELVCL